MVVGISGGIDSSVTAVLCRRAFPETTLGVIMPCHSCEVDRNPQYLETFRRQFTLAVAKSWMSAKELQPETVEYLAEKWIRINGDHNVAY